MILSNPIKNWMMEAWRNGDEAEMKHIPEAFHGKLRQDFGEPGEKPMPGVAVERPKSSAKSLKG